MKLSKLIQNLSCTTKNFNDIEIENLSQNLSKIKKNTLLFCYKGVNFDTHNYLENLNKNVVALVVERFVNSPLPQILVKNTRNIMPKLCNRFFNNALKKLKFVGVTGTNGKTTTTSLIYQILSYAHKNTALIGTNGVYVLGEKIDTMLTTPDTVDLFYLFSYFTQKNVEYVVMEVSAHALALNKLKGIKFEVGAFTNLTLDHLDFFKTMGNYALSKLKFLKKSYSKKVLINMDDDYGKLFYKVSNSKIYTYSIDNPSDNFAMDIKYNLKGTSFIINSFDNIFEIKSPLLCKFNVYNVLCAVVTAKLLDISNEDIFGALKTIQKIDGRMNFYDLKDGKTVVIDYAHTPDGMENVLKGLKNITNNKIITVFGCGGNRDRNKRSKMGKIASFYSDKVIVTSDNPREENEDKIIDDIVLEIKDYIREKNRKKAIELAINEAKTGDIIAILGKGNEKTQEIKGVKYPFSDYEVIKEYLK